MKATLRTVFLALAIMALAVPANAGPFEDGMAAYNRGDYATALKLWRPLAEQGDTIAQSNLGVMYEFGLGVPRDFVQAYLWFGLAVAQGNAVAQQNRDITAGQMAPEQIAEAQRMTCEWLVKYRQ